MLAIEIEYKERLPVLRPNLLTGVKSWDYGDSGVLEINHTSDGIEATTLIPWSSIAYVFIRPEIQEDKIGVRG